MEKITELLNNFTLEQYIPQLDTLMGWVQWLVSLAVRLGPICILVLGIIYFLIPPKEANRKAGFRTYFGMGSVIAWNVTQRLAGILMIPTGLDSLLDDSYFTGAAVSNGEFTKKFYTTEDDIKVLFVDGMPAGTMLG